MVTVNTGQRWLVSAVRWWKVKFSKHLPDHGLTLFYVTHYVDTRIHAPLGRWHHMWKNFPLKFVRTNICTAIAENVCLFCACLRLLWVNRKGTYKNWFFFLSPNCNSAEGLPIFKEGVLQKLYILRACSWNTQSSFWMFVYIKLADWMQMCYVQQDPSSWSCWWQNLAL